MFQNEKIIILYGSQTGNAEDLAQHIWRESKLYYFLSVLKPMDDYNISELIKENCVVFVCSTTGQGEEPSNMKVFWRFLLRKTLPLHSLKNLRFAVFGLGDSSYAKYNFVAKKLYKRLLQLGGNPIIDLGLGDDQHDLGYNGGADPWIDLLWSKLLSIYPLPLDVEPLSKNQFIVPRWNVTTTVRYDVINKSQSIYYSTRKKIDCCLTVLENKRTTRASHFQDVRFIKLETNGQPYAPGDVLTLRPKNLPWQVEEFKNVLKSNNVIINDNDTFNLTENSEIPVPEVLKQPLTFQQLCEEYFDLMAVPRRLTFNILAQLTDSRLEKEKCLEFITAEGQNELYTYCNRPRRNIVEVLQDFPNATKKLNRKMLFEIIPPIKARDFSIASSHKMHQNEIHILVAVVKYKTKLLVKDRFGLCSNFLADLKVGDNVLAWTKKGSFKFPNSDERVIMVGPGTGIAPFRSFISERDATGLATKDNSLLFFGCRNRNMDFHCKEDFFKLEQERKITLIPAYSREQEQKIYVQHKILENQDLVWEFLQGGCYVFVAGSSKSMPQQVREAFVKVCEKFGKMTGIEAENFIKHLEKINKYQTECWS